MPGCNNMFFVYASALAYIGIADNSRLHTGCPDFWNCVANYYRRNKTGVTVLDQALEPSRSNRSKWETTGTQAHNWLFRRSYKVNAGTAFTRYLQLDITQQQGLFQDQAARIGETKKTHESLAVKLRNKHAGSIMFGKVDPVDLIMRLAFTSDRTDIGQGLVSQWTHTLQMWHVMKLDGVTDLELLFAALIHDVGKMVSFLEDDSLSDGCSTGLNYDDLPDGAGMANITLPFDHHDFGADKFRKYVSPRVYRLLRYHCFVDLAQDDPRLKRVMNERDTYYVEDIKQFMVYDQLSKSMWLMPNVDMLEIRSVMRKFLPPLIVF
eukprot:TRINITY_DN102338_c0_g1_i1.p1 TRINITY_DN102338_c0_g1~~TRINITY_DN102338_c0_g1_i1.p1  ORF type:complete len:322 (-),score=45.78 TRINITY_DN102338_c0_g1_i1:80-1045(-)